MTLNFYNPMRYNDMIQFLSVFFFFLRQGNPGRSGPHCVDWDMEFRDPPGSAYQVLGLKAYAAMPNLYD